MTIGSRIKQLREAKKMTQEDLGKAIHSTKQTIFKYENGIITNIPMDKVEIIARKLDCTPAYLMGWTTDVQGNINDKEPLIIPEEYRDLWVAFHGGTDGLTQEDINAVIRFVEFLKNNKKN